MKPDQILASLSQLGHQKRPVTLFAIVFFTMVCLSLGGMQGWSVYKARDVQLRAATVATSNMSHALADHVGSAVDLADTILSEVVDRIQRQEDAADVQRLSLYLGERVHRTPLLSDLAVYDAEGGLSFSSRNAPAGVLPVHAQLDFHKGVPGAALLVGVPLRHPGNGEWLLPLSRRLVNHDGTFGGIALATIRLSRFREFYKDFELGREGAITVALDSGALLMTRNDDEPAIGRDMRAGPVLSVWRQHGANGSLIRDGQPQTGTVETLYSFRHLGNYPILVAVTRPTSEILADWWESAYLSTAGVSLLMLIQLWLGIRLYGQIALRDRLETDRRSLQKLLVKKSRSLRRQAFRDALTGIANRRQFDTRLVREFNRAADSGSPLALVILDVDFFKKYNDQYGHPAGDECLKLVAGCVNGGRRRSQDLAARMGGEEFAILLPNTGLRGAIAVAEAIRKSVAAHKMTHLPGKPHSVTVSCGVHAMVPTEGMSPIDLVAAADKALYLAKSSGRNRVRAEGTMPDARSKRFSLVVNK
jgi:diguanylate cyclase (GGDEF)-like protein